MQRSESRYLNHLRRGVQARRVSLFDMKLGEVMVMQNRKELFSTKLEHIFVSFKLEHAVPQGLGVCSSQERSS